MQQQTLVLLSLGLPLKVRDCTFDKGSPLQPKHLPSMFVWAWWMSLLNMQSLAIIMVAHTQNTNKAVQDVWNQLSHHVS